MARPVTGEAKVLAAVRYPMDLKQYLDREAARNRRSFTAEVIIRLERDIEREKVVGVFVDRSQRRKVKAASKPGGGG